MSAYSDEERSALKAQAADCFFITVRSPQTVGVMAYPRKQPKRERQPMFNCPELFAGATVHINGSKPEWAK